MAGYRMECTLLLGHIHYRWPDKLLSNARTAEKSSLCYNDTRCRRAITGEIQQTSLSRVFLEKLTVTQLLYRIHRTYHSSLRLSWSRQIQSTSSYSTSLRPVLVLFFNVCLYLLSRHFYSGFRTTVLYIFLNFLMLHAHAPHISSYLILSP
jgi:hypothetical protein